MVSDWSELAAATSRLINESQNRLQQQSAVFNCANP